jgi:HAD superfamily phosphoserine phosphatase-like hydrolase
MANSLTAADRFLQTLHEIVISAATSAICIMRMPDNVVRSIKKSCVDVYLYLAKPLWRKKHILHNTDSKRALFERVKLAVFDLDGTLTCNSNSWKLVSQALRPSCSLQKERNNFKAYIANRISREAFYENSIKLWQPPPAKAFFDNLKTTIKIQPGATELIGHCRQLGIRTCIISSGFDIFAQYVSGVLGIEQAIANELQFDTQGKLQSIKINVTPHNKIDILSVLSEKAQIEKDDVMFVSNDSSDIKAVTWAGLGVFLNNDNMDKAEADIIINSIQELADVFVAAS